MRRSRFGCTLGGRGIDVVAAAGGLVLIGITTVRDAAALHGSVVG
jgi:hypothetical protein